jgi:anaerobic selenocysteine-containing dehydrogenase
MLPNGMAQLSITPLPDHELQANELLLMTIRSHDQFNTTIYGLNDRYRGIHNERRVVFMNEEDMTEKGLTQLDVVNLHSHYDGIQRTAEKFLIVTYNIPKGNMAAYFPETNMLVPHNHFADKSQTPISKSIRVTVEKIL